MTELKLNAGYALRVAAQNGKIELICVPPEAAEPVLLAEISDVYCINPYLFIDKAETLWLFYTAVHGADTDTAQVMYRCSFKGDYSESAVTWGRYEAVYPRLGGSFTDAKESDGVNEEQDTFTPELCGRYEKIGRLLSEKPGYSESEFSRFVEEKRLLALGKLYGVKTKKNSYPFARRTGFSLRGSPLECEINGKLVLLLPLYSSIFSCALLLYSLNGGRDFDSADYLLCGLDDDGEFVLSESAGTIRLDIRAGESLVPAGETADLGRTWQVLYDYSAFAFAAGTGEDLKPAKSFIRQYKIKFFAKNTLSELRKFTKQIIHNERPFDFSKNKPSNELCRPFTPVPINGLDGYDTPQIEDIFSMIKEHAHGSGIASLPDGELLSVWFQSDGERKGNDGRIVAARKPADGEWQESFVIADVFGMADCNPTVFVDKKERLWFFWYPVLANCWESSQPKFMVAEKGGYEYANGYITDPKWEKSGILNPSRSDELQGKATGFKQGKYIYGEVNGECRYITQEQFAENPLTEREYVKLEDRYITDSFLLAYRNSIFDTVKFLRDTHVYAFLTPLVEIYLWREAERVCRTAAGVENSYKKWRPITRPLGWQTKNKPIEFEYNGKTRLLLSLYSDGLHCALNAYTDDGGDTWGYGLPFGSIAPEQAASVQLKDGRLRSYFRNSEPTRHIISYESSDGGNTFGNLQIDSALLHEGGFDIVKLKNGIWVMSITDPYLGKGIRPHNRARLQIAVSKDEGETWDCTPLEVDNRGRRAFHYSAITEGADGTVYVSYSYDDENGMNNIRCARIRRSGLK